MIWNNALKREIPEGWEVKSIGEFLNLYQPKTISEEEICRNQGEYCVYGANGIIGKYHKFNHKQNEIAITCRGNTCGNMLMTLPYSYITGNAMIVGMTDMFDHKEYVYNNLLFVNRNKYITGSAQPQITASNLKTLKMIVPDDYTVSCFDQIANPIRVEINKLLILTNDLNDIKSKLLPVLINGQLKV